MAVLHFRPKFLLPVPFPVPIVCLFFILSSICPPPIRGQSSILTQNLPLTESIPGIEPVNLFDITKNLPKSTRTNSQVPTLAEAKYYALFTAAVYCHDPELSDWTCVHCTAIGKNARLVGVVSSSAHNTRVMVNVDSAKREIVITFRGTTNLRNFVLDSAVLLIHPGVGKSGIKVHQGAWMAMKSLYDDVVKILRGELGRLKNRSVETNVVIAGHSLGGMEASLFLYALRHSPEFKNLQFSLYSYGQPRVGNLEFANWMNSQKFKIVRVVNNRDGAPHVLTWSTPLGYVHFNTELWIQSSGESKFCARNLFEDPTCSNSKGPLYTAQDHLKYWEINYLSCAEKSPLPNIATIV